MAGEWKLIGDVRVLVPEVMVQSDVRRGRWGQGVPAPPPVADYKARDIFSFCLCVAASLCSRGGRKCRCYDAGRRRDGAKGRCQWRVCIRVSLECHADDNRQWDEEEPAGPSGSECPDINKRKVPFCVSHRLAGASHAELGFV